VLSAALAMAACSSSKIPAKPSVSAGGSGGSAGAGGTAGSAGDSGTAGGAGASCKRTNDFATISVASGGGNAIDCNHVPTDGGFPASTSGTLEGSVTSVTASSFTINTCPPNANCVDLRTFKVSAPGLQVTVPKSAFVRVDYSFSQSYWCTQSLEVDSLPSWGGVANPTGMGAVMLLAVVDGAFGGSIPEGSAGDASAPSGSVYTVRIQALGCDADAGTGCGTVKPDEYALDFAPSAAPSRSVRVLMGQTLGIDLLQTQGPNNWHVRNLRSYQTGACDDYGNFAWFLAWQPPDP
jgi:hypothetical protein